jgi:hypothetical protein
MTVNAELARIYGSDTDAIYLAPLGTTLPLAIDSPLDPEFEDVGWLHSDGITESATGSVNKIRGYQGNNVIRTYVSEGGTTIAFVALETKAQTTSLRYDVKETTSASGVRTEKRGPGQKVALRACVIDVFDTDDTTIKERLVIERLEISSNGDRIFTAADIAGFSFIGEVIGDYTSFSTDLESVEE